MRFVMANSGVGDLMSSDDHPSLEQIEQKLAELEIEVRYLKGLKRLIRRTDHLRQRQQGTVPTPGGVDGSS